MKWYIMIAIFIAPALYADDLIQVKELSTEYRNMNCGETCGMRHAYLPSEESIKYSVLHTTDLRISKYFLLQNKFFFDGSAGVEYVGLEYRVGLEIPVAQSSSISFGKWHHSSHAVDRQVRDGRFPVTDALFIKFNWLQFRGK